VPPPPILITGFEPYGGRDINPSLEIMRHLDGRTISGREIIGRGLPVSLARLRGTAERMIDEFRPAAVIGLGLWPGETIIRIERLAVNLADFEISDNDGNKAMDTALAANGSTALFATLPLRAIARSMLERGIPAMLSASAGTFLCNACLYEFLSVCETSPNPILCGFIHVPYFPEQVAAILTSERVKPDGRPHRAAQLASMGLDQQVQAIEAAISETVKSLEGQSGQDDGKHT